MGSLVKAVEGIHDRDEFFELEDRIPYNYSIFPKNSQQVDRPVKIGRAAQVNGSIYGRGVEILNGFSSRVEDTTRTLSIFGREYVSIGNFCRIGGHVTCAGNMTIGELSRICGDAIAHNDITIKSGSKVSGNVISEENINIEENVHIGGYVIALNGGVAFRKNSQAYDIIASGDIILDDETIFSDPIIWSKEGNIEFSSITIGKNHPINSKMSDVIFPGEINPYPEAINTFDYQKLMEELKRNLLSK